MAKSVLYTVMSNLRRVPDSVEGPAVLTPLVVIVGNKAWLTIRKLRPQVAELTRGTLA